MKDQQATHSDWDGSSGCMNHKIMVDPWIANPKLIAQLKQLDEWDLDKMHKTCFPAFLRPLSIRYEGSNYFSE